jgi:hypothetical protein
MKCPFKYADGHQCGGDIWRARAYGKSHHGAILEEDIRKIRLWCSEKNDHVGAVPSRDGKDRMEFYSDELVRMGLYAEAITMCENVEADADDTENVGVENEAQEQLPPAFDSRTPEQREAEELNTRVQRLWPEEWEATRRLSRNNATKRRKALRARMVNIDKKNAGNAGFMSPSHPPT